ncbi:porin family protein [Mucilaginibacter sp. BT774]|uniref:porin family protein n=1 Tax=Mucilaginibacter sp. BT774 TaxID=3062276 RepID=UPI002676926F|nr:porin family protein [Mucilaginibacter sp. BT774]MDO3624689.1 porin family protein [Mucilaginibacter sp. BT774]
MKKFLLTVCIAAVSVCAFAQSISYSIKGGISLSTFSNSGYPGVNESDRIDFRIGAVAEYSLHQFSIQPGLYYITKGSNVSAVVPYYNNSNSNSSQPSLVYEKGTTRLHYLELPVNVLYHLNLSNLNLFFGAGPYLGYGLNGKETATATGAVQQKYSADVKFGSGYKNPDYGINFIVGERIKHISIDLNYSLGLRNLTGSPDNKLRNRSAGVSAGYWFK